MAAAAGYGYEITSANDVLKMGAGEKESDQLRFAVLTGLVKVGQVTNKDVLNTVLHLLVGGEFDMENNFVIKDPKNVRHMMELLRDCEDSRLQAEIWSMFIPLLRKSLRNLQACTEIGLIEHVLTMLPSVSEMVADLLIDLLSILASYSITVKELKMLFGYLQGNKVDKKWPVHAHKLLTVLRQLPKRQGPEEFFSFPGKKGEKSDKYNQALALPPLKAWPYQSGWTFSTWLRLDPVTGINIEKEKPYLYSFRTNKGIGYSGHFVGNCLVITAMKVKGKGFQHCVKYEFKPRRWHMVTLVHVYNRWSKSELKCYVNGQLVSSTEMSWLVTPSTGEAFDRCFLGSAPEINPDNMFSGQMATVYLFSEALSAQQICAMHKLSSGYKGQYKFENESCLMLSEAHRKVLYDGKLSSAIAAMYSPVSCDSQLCLESSPKENPSYFLHSPHALMSGDVCAILTQSIHSTLHSIGGVQVLFPLFTQLDFDQAHIPPELNGSAGNSPPPQLPPSSATPSPNSSPAISATETGICASLLSFLCDLLETSVTVQQQMLHAKGFLVIARLLEKSPDAQAHINTPVLEAFLKLTKYLVAQPTGRKLLKHLFDYVLFNPELWIYASVDVQTRLYTYLATEFVSDAQIYTNIRRVSSVLQTMHSLKYYYWVINPEPRSGVPPKGLDGPRPSADEILTLRAFILLYVKQLILKGDGVLDDELQSMLNFLHTMHEDDNIQDVLQLLVALMSEHPKSMVPAFDRKGGIKTVFKLLASSNEAIRLQALKLLGFFLMRSTLKRKTESMNLSNLFSLLNERLLLHEDQLRIPTYNVLFEILTERMTSQILYQNHQEPESWFRIENSAILKVIATLIRNSKQTTGVFNIKRLFLSDLTILLNKSKENRRTVLQMSVWQEWLISLAYVHPANAEEQKMTDMVFAIFRILLHHAIKYEYGGWRVWIDTLAILHSKVSYEDFKIHCSQLYDQFERQRVENIDDPDQVAQHPVSSVSKVSEDVRNPPARRPSGVTITELKEDESEPRIINGHVDPLPSSTTTASTDAPMTSLDKAKFYEKLGFDQNLVAFLSEIVEDASKVVEKRVGEVVDGAKTLDGFPQRPPPPSSSRRIVEKSAVVDSEDVTLNLASSKDDGKAAKPLINGMLRRSEDRFSLASDSPDSRRRGSKASSSTKGGGGATAAASGSGANKKIFTPGPAAPPFRIPEFKWSKLHQKLLSDVLFALETDIQVWKSHNTKTVIDFVNASTSAVFVVNTVHMISQLADNLINACGGLLPLLASATSANGEIDVIHASEGLPLDIALAFLQRLMNLTDILVFASSMGFSDLEHEKNMANGGILRQCLRLVATCAVRNCLECRNIQIGTPLNGLGLAHDLGKAKGAEMNGEHLNDQTDDDIIKTNLAANAGTNQIKDTDHLLQEMDINRLRAVVYRDVDESKQAQFLALSIVYFISVLMVSKYRDVLEPPTGTGNGKEAKPSSKETVAASQTAVNGTVSKKEEKLASLPSTARSSKSRSPSPPPPPPEAFTTTDVMADLRSIKDMVKNDGYSAKASAPAVAQLPVSEVVNITAVGKKQSLPPMSYDAGAKRSSMMEDVDPEDAMAKIMEDDPTPAVPNEYVDTIPAPVLNDGGSPSKNPLPPPDMFQDEGKSDENSAVNGDADPSAHQQIISSISTLSQYPGFDSQKGASEAGLSTTASASVATVITKPEDLDNFSSGFGNLPLPNSAPGGTSPASLTHRLENALGTTAPILKEIMIDFAPFLSKTLIGSHGQELVVGGLTTLKGSSVVELVMLLCSQEWQNSLQKHAGLAFIELVNEGRLLSHATKDHIVRVANEAEFILNRMRAEDVMKHAEFESVCAQNVADRKEEEKLCDHLISAARRRDHVRANKLLEKVVNLLTSSHGAWGAGAPLPNGGRRPSVTQGTEFWRLDVWEDDLRRRRRLIKNPYGTTHPDATLRQPTAGGDHDKDANGFDIDEEAALHAHMAQVGGNPDAVGSHVGSEDSESMQQLDLEREFDAESPSSGKPVALSTQCQIIAPGIVMGGTLSITSNEVYFEVDEEDEEFHNLDARVLNHSIDVFHFKFSFQEIRAVFARRYLLQNTALEIFLASRTAVMFNFEDGVTVKKVVGLLPRVGVGVKYGIQQQRRASLANSKQLYKMANMTQRWQRREISNFEYLMFLNTIAGRSYNDLNQYPVFPWVLINYESAELDLNLPSNYRDLSKPIGALNPSRRAFFNERFSSWESDTIPPFHYGTHYSTAAFTLNWLVRTEPFSSLFINLQSGKFDHPNRLFHSIAQSWRNCQRDTSDVKELIPEFFYLPEMFVNKNQFQLGRLEDGTPVGDVELPKWAKSPEDFVRINRQALESEFVSCQLHHWIDLIFGYKQKGPEAARSTNVFYYLTYEGSVNLNEIADPVAREAIENQIRHFGQTPSQLLTEPHPPRSSAMHMTPMMFTSHVTDDVSMIMKFLSNSPVTHVSGNTHPAVQNPAVITIAVNKNFAVNKWNNNASQPATLPSANASNSGNANASAEKDGASGTPNVTTHLPLAMDPIISTPGAQHRRHLGEHYDENIPARHCSFVVTADNRFIVAAGFWDNSFRIFNSDTGKIVQVIFGHFDVVTVVARSECNIAQDCFLATGSLDATVMLWHWNNQLQQVVGDLNVQGEAPSPRTILTGHETDIVALVVSAELGLVMSASYQGPVLIHTTTGDLLRSLESPDYCTTPENLAMSREGNIFVNYDLGNICLYSLNGKLLRHRRHEDNILCMTTSRDGQYLLTGGEGGVVAVWRTFDLNLLYTYPTCDGSIRSVALSHCHQFVLTGLSTGSVVVFNIDFNKWHPEFQEKYH